MTQISFLDPAPMAPIDWAPSRDAAKQRWQDFLPKAGGRYARDRNFDYGPEDRTNVSALSPWIRHRLITEPEILSATLARHSFKSAEKFIQEVFWRGYFKGWLEHRPEVWQRYRLAVRDQVNRLDQDANLADRYTIATTGATGIGCFDAWAKELVTHGYLHNHARMWFASIWIYTLDLPWELGADFFYRHLLDGDPASNTCSWRWVGGLHTKGKTYLARASNIERYTNGRFNPVGQLAAEAPALVEPELATLVRPKFADFKPESDARLGLLVTEEDCSVETLPLAQRPHAILALSDPTPRSLLPLSPLVADFSHGAVQDAAKRAGTHAPTDVRIAKDDNWAKDIADWARAHQLDILVTARLPIGPVKRRLYQAVADLDVPLIEITRPYDSAVWPHARKGFFGLKKKLPTILADIGLGA